MRASVPIEHSVQAVRGRTVGQDGGGGEGEGLQQHERQREAGGRIQQVNIGQSRQRTDANFSASVSDIPYIPTHVPILHARANALHQQQSIRKTQLHKQ